MTGAKEIFLPLLLVLLYSCAPLQQQDKPDMAAKERREQKKEIKPPTFTYRPGS